jgi:hypothetical protein
MSKGWESKSVEEQQAEASAPKLSSSVITPEARRADADKRRRIQALEMQRERVLSERTSNPHRRNALEMALATLELELEKLGWSIKL